MLLHEGTHFIVYPEGLTWKNELPSINILGLIISSLFQKQKLLLHIMFHIAGTL